MKALVTGANGLVGANLVRELLREGHDVRAFVRRKSDRRSLANLEMETVFGDVLDAASLGRAARGCDVVFHAAAVFAYWNHSAEELKNIAVEGTLNTVNAAHAADVGRVVLTSSTVVLGSSAEKLVQDEDSRGNETDAYAAAKAAQEDAAFARAAQLGLHLVAACPGMCLGAHDYRLSPSNALICSYLKDPWKLTWAGGINLVSVRDVARGHLLLAQKGVPGRRYVLGSENLDWPTVHETIAQLCGTSAPKYVANHTFSYLGATAQELFSWVARQPPLSTRAQAKMVGRYYWYSHQPAARLGYVPSPARAALAEAIAWLLSTPHIPMPLRAELQPTREVYAAWEKLCAAEEQLSRHKGPTCSRKFAP